MSLYERYVDDILVIYEGKKVVNYLLNKLTLFKTILCEEEKNDQLSFLNIFLESQLGQAITLVTIVIAQFNTNGV